MSILVDTNVFLSAAWRDRLPERVVLHIATDDSFRWIVTPAFLAEYIGVLRRPKFSLPESVLQRWTALLDAQTTLVPNPPVDPTQCRDPKDAIFLAAAIANQAHFLVTGDKDLLQLTTAIPTCITSIADFAAQFQIQ